MQAKSGSIAEIVTKTKETAEKVAQQQAEIKKNVKASKVNIKELAPSAGKWSVDPKIDMDTLTSKQTAAVSYLKAVSEVSGMNITLMSGVDVTGAFSVENGHYDGVTNTLYVSVNAGMQSITDITGSAILKTASHEITHYIAASGTQTYSLLEDYVMSRFTEQYGEKSVDNRIEDIQEQYRDQVGKELTREQAKEEMVAAACEMMLKNSEVFEKLARQNLSLAQRIKAGLDGFIKKLSANRKAAFENLDATSPEARAIAASETSLKETQKLWDNALKGAIKENEGGKSAGTGSMSEIRSYDYSKTFAQQIDDYKAGKFPRNDTLVVCGTPEVFQKIGLNALPMTYTQGHLRDALANVDGDHLGEALLKNLPAAMQNPLAIINSETKPGRLVAIVEIQGQTRNTIAAVEIDGTGRMHSYTIDANAITSAHSRDNALSNLLKNAVASEIAGKNSIYYWQKNKAIQRLNGIGVQFPGASSIADGYIHSIRDAGSFVNTKFENVTQTQQFKRWFGDWQKNPKRASKVVNADGTPRVMYHYTDSTFAVFDPARSGSNQGMRLGDGIYISSSKTAFMDYGKNRMDVYADIKHPFEMKLTKAQADEVLNTYAATKHNLDAYGGVYRKHAQQKLMTPTRVMDYLSEYAADNGIKTSDILKHLGYDGIHDGIEWVAFDPTQIKSATDNIGTFDRNNPDIRYELRDNQGRELTKAQAEKFKDSQVRDKDGRLKTVYHGSSAVFNVFSADFMSQHGSSEGQGFYFTDYKDMAEGYQKKGGQLLEGYLNITNPLSDSEVTLSAPEVKRLLKALDPTGDDVILNYDSQGGMGYPSKAWYNRALSDTVNMIMSTSESDSEILAEIANAGAGSGNVMDAVRKVLGYDGYIVEGKYDNANVYVAFGSDQFKSFDNKTPTSSPDIRFELRTTDSGTKYALVTEDISKVEVPGKPDASLGAKARYILNERFRNTVLQVGENDRVYVNKGGLNEYANPAKKLTDSAYAAKLSTSAELNELLKTATNVRTGVDDGRHPDAVRGWKYYEVLFAVKNSNIKEGYSVFEGKLNVKQIARGDLFHDITDIKEITSKTAGQNILSSISADSAGDSNSIFDIAENVNTEFELRSDENQFNPRKELSNLFMQIAQNEQEKKSLRSYQAAIHELNNTEIEISKLQQEMQGTDKLKSPQKYYELQNKLRQAEAKLNRYDGRLVQLEATKPMKDLIARREQRLKEQFARSSTTRAKYRNNIKKNIRSLDKKLRTNSGQKHVLLELQPVVAQLLNVFTENTSVFKKEQLARLREIYAKFSPAADSKISSNEKEVTRWKSTAEYSSAYSEMIYDLIEEVRLLVQGKRLIDLDTDLLAAVNDIVSNIKQKTPSRNHFQDGDFLLWIRANTSRRNRR